MLICTKMLIKLTVRPNCRKWCNLYEMSGFLTVELFSDTVIRVDGTGQIFCRNLLLTLLAHFVDVTATNDVILIVVVRFERKITRHTL